MRKNMQEASFYLNTEERKNKKQIMLHCAQLIKQMHLLKYKKYSA